MQEGHVELNTAVCYSIWYWYLVLVFGSVKGT